MDDFELARFVETKYAKRALLDKEGHVFNINRRNLTGSKCYWTCREYKRSNGDKCSARAITEGIRVLVWKGQHNHDVVEAQLQDYSKKYTGYDKRSNKVWERPDGV